MAGDGPRQGALLRSGPTAVAQGGRVRLIGREHDVAELAGLVRRRRPVTVTGPPGVGKSRLALEATAYLGVTPEVAVVGLGSVRDPAAVAPAVWQAVEAGKASRELPGARVADDGARVLILDDCEHVRAAAAEVAQKLGPAGVRVIATSEQPLGVEGEVIWRLGPLAVPPPRSDAMPEVVVESEAVRLFCERATDVHQGFVLSSGTAPSVAAICRRLDGLPLAIELAARRVDVLSLAEILARLEQDPVVFLDARPHDGASSPPRSLRAAIEASCERLSVRERVLWVRLSVFAGDFGLQGAQAVTAGDEMAPEQVLEVLAALVAASLVQADTTASPSRYRLLEPLRDYARQRLEDVDEAATLAAAHARWYLKLTEQAGDPRHGRPWVEHLAPEHANIEAAWRWALSANEPELAVGLARAHAYLCRAGGRHSEGRTILEEVSSLAPAAAMSGAAVLGEAGGAAAVTGHLAIANTHLEQGAVVARGAGDAAAEARALAVTGMLATVRGDRAGGLAAVEQALALARATDHEPCLVDSLVAAGRARLLVGETTDARACFAEAVTLASRLADESATANALTGAGQAALVQGDYAEAGAALTEGLALASESSEVHTQNVALVALGELARLRGDADAAEQRFRECARLAREAATPHPLALALLGLGRVAQAAEDTRAARGLFDEALTIARNAGLAHVIPPCLVRLAQLDAAANNREGAQRLLDEALKVARLCADKAGEAQALSELGRMASVAGDPNWAASRHHQALVLHADIGDPAAVADSVQALAAPAADNGRFTAAARLLGAARSIRESHGCVPEVRQQSEYDVHRRAARRGLGAEAFAIAWAQGAALSKEEAIAYASKGRGRRRRPAKGWEALTPAEHRVVALAQQGLGNAQIAERLLISRRTVDAHLAHVYAKLGIRSRIQLMVAMQLSAARGEPGDPGSQR